MEVEECTSRICKVVLYAPEKLFEFHRLLKKLVPDDLTQVEALILSQYKATVQDTISRIHVAVNLAMLLNVMHHEHPDIVDDVFEDQPFYILYNYMKDDEEPNDYDNDMYKQLSGNHQYVLLKECVKNESWEFFEYAIENFEIDELMAKSLTLPTGTTFKSVVKDASRRVRIDIQILSIMQLLECEVVLLPSTLKAVVNVGRKLFTFGSVYIVATTPSKSSWNIKVHSVLPSGNPVYSVTDIQFDDWVVEGMQNINMFDITNEREEVIINKYKQLLHNAAVVYRGSSASLAKPVKMDLN